MEDMQHTTTQQPNRAGPVAEHTVQRLPEDIERFVQRRPVKIALISCAGLGVIAGGSALISTLRARATQQQRARAWVGREAGLVRRKARHALGSYGRSNASDIVPGAGLIAAGALIGAGLALFLSQRRSAGETVPGAIDPSQPTAQIASPVAPDYH